MGVIYFVGGEENEQSYGATLDSGQVKMYVLNRSNPTEMIFLGGHPVGEGFSYTLTERKISQEYVHRNGRNLLIERTLTGEKVKGITFNMMVPNKTITVSDRVYQQMNKGVKYDLVFVPSTCQDGCEAWYWLAEDVVFGVRQYNSSPVGYDENENPITSQRSVFVVGNIKHYFGMETTTIYTSAEVISALYVVDEDCETGCPYQHIVYGNDAGAVKFSTDGGANWTSITTTTITTAVTGAKINSVLYKNGIYLAAANTHFQGVGTDGEIGYSVGGAAFALASLVDEAGAATTSLGFNVMLEAFGKIWAFGQAGTIWSSVDNGLTFVLKTQTTVGASDHIYAAAFDAINGLIYLATAAGSAFAFDGTIITEITTEVGAGAVDLISVAVTAPGHVVFGDADGLIHSNYTANDLSTDYSALSLFGTGGLVNALAGDGYSARVLAGGNGATADVKIREVLNEQNWQSAGALYQAGGVPLVIVATKPLLDEGVNAFFIATDGGEIHRFASCKLCI